MTEKNRPKSLTIPNRQQMSEHMHLLLPLHLDLRQIPEYREQVIDLAQERQPVRPHLGFRGVHQHTIEKLVDGAFQPDELP